MRCLVPPRLRLLLATLALAACGDSVTVIECPLGTIPQGSVCVPIDTPDTVAATDTSTAPDTTTPLLDTAGPADTGPPADTNGDEDTAAPPGAIGASCALNADCAGGTCLDWPGGYCTALGCDDDCPAGSTCMTVEGNNRVCLSDCATASDCRDASQACKRLRESADGALRDVCVGVLPGAGGAGATCLTASDCAGQAACLSAFPGGYCAVLDCPANTCPSEARCVRVDGEPSCLLACGGDDDCPGDAGGAPRRCGTLDAVGGGTVDVCISGIADRQVGEVCASDFECATGTCEILGEGRCSQTNGPCFVATVDADCSGAEFCFVTGDSRVGVCTQPCGPGSASCPGASFCVADGADPYDGTCRPTCDPGVTPCAADLGLDCRYGVPISDGGQGRYACTRPRPRELGWACTSDAGCASNRCVTPAGGGEGYCTTACVDDGVCPFLGVCAGAEAQCHLACFSESDCVAGMACGLANGSARPICAP